MTNNVYRALVVDDQSELRRLVMRALGREGFSCDGAGDGNEAEAMLQERSYDVLVTDLRMPRRHGHALASEVLTRRVRPLVVILTGVTDPRLARDLLGRGVDHIEFKPVDHGLFALKIRAMVDRRRRRADRATQRPPGGRSASGQAAIAQRPRIDPADLEEKLAHLSKILPVSQAAFDVFHMAGSNDFETEQIAVAIARDASLTIDVLRLANSTVYNPCGTEITELKEAVVRIGRKRIGELALATSTLSALTANLLPWLNVELAWRRSVAAGVAIDLLLSRSAYRGSEKGLFLTAIMHAMGRVALAMLYPRQYQAMIELCGKDQETLAAQEDRLLQISHSEVMSRLLQSWNVPAPIHEPLPYVTRPYHCLTSLPEPLRTKTELVKLAILIGRIAVGQWEPWDCVELPPSTVPNRLVPGALAGIIDQTATNAGVIIRFRTEDSAAKGEPPSLKSQPEPTHELAYCVLCPEPFDLLAEILTRMRFALAAVSPEKLQSNEHLLINALRAPPSTLVACYDRLHGDGPTLVITGSGNLQACSRHGRTLALRASYAALQAACLETARPLHNAAGSSGKPGPNTGATAEGD